MKNATTKRFVLIADSLGVGIGSSPQRGWTYYFKDELGLSDENCIISQQSGYGFVAQNNGFKTLLNNASVSNPSTITDVICLGGLNDINATNDYSTMCSAVDDFVDTAISKFPNATIHIGQLGRSRDQHDVINSIIMRNLPAMKQNTKSHYVSGCENLCHDYWRFSDTWHLTSEYYEEIGRKLAHEYDTYVTVSSNLTSVPVTVASGTATGSHVTFSCYQNDNTVHLYTGELFVEFNTPIYMSGNYVQLTLGTQTYQTLLRGNGQYTVPLCGFLGLRASTSGTTYYHPVPMVLGFFGSNGEIRVYFNSVYAQVTSWFHGYVVSIQAKIPSLALDALYF